MQDQMRQHNGTQNTAAHETPNKKTGTGKGKKKEIKQETILFTDIKHTKIQVKF